MNKNFSIFCTVIALAATLAADDSSSTLTNAIINKLSDGITINAPNAGGNLPTRKFFPSSVQTKLNVDVPNSADAVHFIRTDCDPSIWTKAYIVKNVDPFVLRGVLKNAIGCSLDGKPCGVDSIQYVDGTGMVLVAAEENLFKSSTKGLTIDRLVELLDRKDLPNGPGRVDLIYFPKYNSAALLLEMMKHSGMGFIGAVEIPASLTYLFKSSNPINQAVSWNADGYHISSTTIMRTDDTLNALIISATGYDMAEALAFLKEIDVPLDEIKVNYKLVEIYAENDQKLGMDFQAWKNNDGLDLFSVAGHYSNNWSGSGLAMGGGHHNLEFFNFNPKWNTRYIDFLTTCGKAKVVSTGSMVIANGKSADLVMKDGLFSIEGQDIMTKTTDGIFVPVSKSVTSDLVETINYKYVPFEKVTKGKPLDQVIPQDSPETPEDQKVKYPPVTVAQGRTQTVEEATDANIKQANGNYFRLHLSGGVHYHSSNLFLQALSYSVIGWDGTGKARTAQSEYSTQIQIDNSGKEFVVGGIQKSSLMRSTSGVPWLKDLPVLGWLFSTESNVVKKSQYVLIASAVRVHPQDKLDAETQKAADSIRKKVDRAEKNPASTIGFQQLWLDDRNNE